MAQRDRKKPAVKEMRIKDVPIKIHDIVVAHQGLMNKDSDHFVTLDDAVLDLIKKGASTIPALNQ